MIMIADEDLQIIKAILAKHLPNVPVWAFGSRVKGTAQPFSDLDLALMTQEPLNISLYTDLKEAFSNSTLPFKVDIVDWASINDEFKAIILEKHVVIA